MIGWSVRQSAVSQSRRDSHSLTGKQVISQPVSQTGGNYTVSHKIN